MVLSIVRTVLDEVGILVESGGFRAATVGVGVGHGPVAEIWTAAWFILWGNIVRAQAAALMNRNRTRQLLVMSEWSQFSNIDGITKMSAAA